MLYDKQEGVCRVCLCLQGAYVGTARTQIAATYLFEGIQSSDPESASVERPRSLFMGLDMRQLSD